MISSQNQDAGGGARGGLTKRTPIAKAKNLGPVSAREFASLGMTALERLQEMGWTEACLLSTERYPARVNLNAFVSVIGAIEERVWHEIDPAVKEEARRLIARLRAPR